MGRDLALQDQGVANFFEAKANGRNKAGLKAPATLAGDYEVLLLAALPAGIETLQIDATGQLTTTAAIGGTLNDAYDSGGAGAGRIITTDSGAVEMNTPALSGNACLSLDQDDNQNALVITKDGTGANDGINVTNAGTGAAIQITQNGIATNAALQITSAAASVGLKVTQNGLEDAAQITQTTNDVGLFVNKTGAGTGEVILARNAGTGPCISVDQNGAGKGIFIDQDGNAVALDIDVFVSSTNPPLQILNAGTGSAIKITQDGTAFGIEVIHNGGMEGMRLTQEANKYGIRVFKAGTGGDGAIRAQSDGTGPGFQMNQDGAGIAMLCDQNGNQIGLQIDSEATGFPLLQLDPLAGNSRGDIAFGTARTSSPSGPAEGDLHYNATGEFLGFQFAAFTRIIAGRYGTNIGTSATLDTIAAGVATADTVRLSLAAASGSADDVDTINSSPQASVGDLLVVQATFPDTITAKHATGNLRLDGDADQVVSARDHLILFWDGSDWVQIVPLVSIS
jgi:hypothetical protein